MDIVNLCIEWTCIGGASGIQISGGEPPPTRRRPEQNIKGFSSIFFFASKALLLHVFPSFVFSEVFLLDRPFFPSLCTSYFFLFFYILRIRYSPSKKSVTTWGPLGDHIVTTWWLFVEDQSITIHRLQDPIVHVQTWDLSKNLHNSIFRPNISHTISAYIMTISTQNERT